jgi:alpha-1,6-mannosyltransferase
VDIVGVFFLLAAINGLQRGRPRLAGVMLAMAAGVKPQVALLLPFLWRDGGWRALRGFTVAAAILTVPMLWHGGVDGWAQSASIYADRWEANGGVYELFKWMFGQGDLGRNMIRAKDAARLLEVAAVVIAMWRMWERRASLVRAAYWVQIVLLVFSPVVYPWYLLWALAVAPLLEEGWAAVVWGGTISVAYLAWGGARWAVPGKWLTVEYGALAIALCVMAWVHRRECTATIAAKLKPGHAI